MLLFLVIVKVLAGVLQDLTLNMYFVALKNKNTHLNQAIHEEQEAILELRVQLRLLQSHKLQQELTAQPPAEQAPPTQPSPEARSDEQTKRSVAAVAPTADAAAATTNGKAAKDPSKPSPNKDKRDSNMWDLCDAFDGRLCWCSSLPWASCPAALLAILLEISHCRAH